MSQVGPFIAGMGLGGAPAAAAGAPAAQKEEVKKEAVKNMLEYLKNHGKIIIADFMFANDIERKNCFNNLCEKGGQDLWDVINNKHYTNLVEFEKYINSLGYKIHSEHIVNFTWIVEIEK